MMVVDGTGGKTRTVSTPAQSSDSANATSQKLNKLISGGSTDYDSWRSLILEIESQSPEDIDTISLAYDSFLSTFPLCHWHLEKYAHHKAKLSGPQEAVNIYERPMGVSMYSVGFWVAYFSFGAAYFPNPEDVRRLFRRAITFVDRDYFSHALWDNYMKYEFEQEGWSFLAHSYIQTLRFPTKKLQFYYDNFKQFVANLEEEMQYENNEAIKEQFSVPSCSLIEISTDEVSLTVKDLLDSPDRSVKSKALEKYKSIGEGFYREARQVDDIIRCFEKKIRRRYFYSTPLDDDEIDNWHLYLDFIEKQGNINWAMKLYERCLIPCAHYPEFWMRHVDFLESKGGRELANSALDRSTQIFLKNVPDIHLFNARFKELIGDDSGARDALTLCDTKTDSSLIENAATLANLERRLGNLTAASDIYKNALKDAREKQKMHVLPSLYNHFAQLTFLTTGSAAAARDILIEGVQNIPNCRFLLEELIKFAMTHEGAHHVNIIDPIIDNAISTGLDEYEGLSTKVRESISSLYLEFVNLCGTIHDIRKAWNRHIKLFPQFLRIRTAHNHSTNSGDSKRVKKGEEKPLEVGAAHEIHPTQVPEKPSPQKALALSSEDELSCRSKEHELGPTVGSAVLATQSKESILIPDEPTPEVKMSTTITDENPIEIEHAQERAANNVQEDKEHDKGGPTSSEQQQPRLDLEAMSQMLYHYQQQQLLQQRCQQQMYLPTSYPQLPYSYFNQPAYQMLAHQQLYGQQQPISSIQQQQQQNNQQPQQGMEDPAYHLAYQQQVQQYQQYQGYPHLAGQQQTMEGRGLMQEHQNSTQILSQNQQVSKKVLPDHDAAAESSESPHLMAQSQSTRATVS